MRFRPLPILSIFTAASLVLLCYLGVWQFERSTWKVSEIDAYKVRASQQAVDLQTALCGEDGPVLETPVSTSAQAGAPRIRVYGFSTEGKPGWRYFSAVSTPACFDDERAILVETEFELFQSNTLQPITRTRVDVWPDQRPTFASENEPAKGDWYWFDGPAMQSVLFPDNRLNLDTGHILVADDGLPDYLRRVPPERHIGYSVTWFGLAISLAVLYVAFHIRAGRLTFGKPEDD